MEVKFLLKNILIGLVAMNAINCSQKESVVSITDVCQEKDQAVVQLKGFLVYPQTTPDLTSQPFLLVENKNGTGGFIKLNIAGTSISNESDEVKIIGKVSKDEKGCVLKVEKIETP